MRILVTGASGFLGKALVRELKQRNWSISLMGRSRAKLQERFAEAPLDLIETDYTLPSLRAVVPPCDAVVHLAARRYEKEFGSIADYYENIAFTENLLKAAAGDRVQRFVFASTYSIYSVPVNRLPFREDEPVAPRNLYAISKLAAEGIGMMIRPDFVALRFSQMVGPGEREGFMLMTFIRNALEGKPITLFGRGSGARDYLYVRDAAQAIVRSIEAPSARGVFNIGSGVATSHLELAGMVSRVFSQDRSGIVFDAARPDDPARSQLDISRAARELGWTPAHTLEQAFEEMKREGMAG